MELTKEKDPEKPNALKKLGQVLAGIAICTKTIIWSSN
jgi:hypothetical protein